MVVVPGPAEMTDMTIGRLLLRAEREFGGCESVVDGSIRATFADLVSDVVAAAQGLAARGIGVGDRVALWAPNSYRWVVTSLAIMGSGAILVPLNTRFKAAEAMYVLERSQARIIFIESDFHDIDFAGMLSDFRGHVVDVSASATADPHSAAESWDSFIQSGCVTSASSVRATFASIPPEAIANILFTSGTTGRPKGAMLAHGQDILTAYWWCLGVGLEPGDRYLVVNPYFHSFALKSGIVASLIMGTTMVPMRVLEIGRLLDLVEQERITVLPGPPALYTTLLSDERRHGRDLSSVRLAVTGAAVVPVALLERMRTELPFKDITTAYGLTESCGTVTVNPRDASPEAVSLTVGIPLPGVEMRIVDAEGRSLPQGDQGEVQVRGYNVMMGYLDDPEATAEAITDDGWLRTGDVGLIDAAGHLRITDRVKHMFICGGFNVYPAEVEQVICQMPQVLEAAVVGVPDERLGEVGQAYVTPRPGEHVVPADVIAHCRSLLANFKVPRSVVVVDALPKNAGGKVVKHELRAQGEGGEV